MSDFTEDFTEDFDATTSVTPPKGVENPFAFLAEDIINSVAKIVTDLPAGEHSTMLSSIDEGKSASGSAKLTFVFKTRAGGNAIDTLSFGSLSKMETAFKRLSYLFGMNPEPKIAELLTKIKANIGAIITKSNKAGKTYEIKSSIDLNEKLGADDVVGLSAEDIALKQQEFTKELRKAYNQDIYAQEKEARDNGLQIYYHSASKRSFAMAISKADVEKMLKPLHGAFNTLLTKKFLVTITEKSDYYNGRRQKFMNPTNYKLVTI